MLSRVAESVWWLSRNIERAETIARVLDVNYTRTIERYTGEESLQHWRRVLDIVGMHTELDLIPAASVPATALHYCTFSLENRTSIVSCVRIARQNAMFVRSELSSELWEAINGLYLIVESCSPRTIAREGPSSFLHHVRNSAQSIGGIVDATLLRNEVWDFLQMGRYFERAFLTARMLRSQEWNDLGSEMQTVLQMCCASEPFARLPHSGSEPDRVLSFLMLDSTFPRSVRFALREVDVSLHRVSGTFAGTFSNEAERILGQSLAMLDFARLGEITGGGASQFAQTISRRLDELSVAVEALYFPRIPVAS